MNRPLIVLPDAQVDIGITCCDLEEMRTGLGRKFIAELKVVLERIESMPELHGIVWKDVRAVRVKKFQYIVYYVVFDDRVEVLAVIHGARDSAVWQARVSNS